MFKRMTAAGAVLVASLGMASAHTVTFGWTDNDNGTVTLWNEHWHGFQPFPCLEGVNCSDNGGLTISGDGTGSDASYGLNAYTVQWAGTVNSRDRDDMVADGTLTGYMDDPENIGGGTYDNWLYTAALTIGNGKWWFFTGTNCCIDTMSHPVLVELTGIGSVDPGTGPGDPNGPAPVPLPGALSLMAAGVPLLGLFKLRRRGKAAARGAQGPDGRKLHGPARPCLP